MCLEPVGEVHDHNLGLCGLQGPWVDHGGLDRGGLRPMNDVSPGAWIRPRLGKFGGWVGSVVPRGFDAYARVLHPVPRRFYPGQTTWAAVCASTGRTAHALMQWDAIAGVVETTSQGVTTRTMLWVGGEPATGNLDTETLSALARRVVSHRATDAECFFALWDGHGWSESLRRWDIGGPTTSPKPSHPTSSGRLIGRGALPLRSTSTRPS